MSVTASVFLSTFFAVCLASDAGAGTITGKVVDWRGGADASRPGVVWLEGSGPEALASRPNAVMAQKGGHFVPSFLIVVVGQTVEMPNLDDVAHNVFSVSPAKKFNLGFYAKGEYKSVIFDRPGLVDAVCSIHSFMRAKILVLPNAFYSTVGAGGKFRIHGVPAGSYTLKFWADKIAPVSMEITVPEDGLEQVILRVTPN
jgi:plastocyanin